MFEDQAKALQGLDALAATVTSEALKDGIKRATGQDVVVAIVDPPALGSRSAAAEWRSLWAPLAFLATLVILQT